MTNNPVNAYNNNYHQQGNSYRQSLALDNPINNNWNIINPNYSQGQRSSLVNQSNVFVNPYSNMNNPVNNSHNTNVPVNTGFNQIPNEASTQPVSNNAEIELNPLKVR